MAEQLQQYVQRISPYLDNVPQDQRFMLYNGLSISNLEGLFHILNNSDDPLFYNYVNGQKNDFVNWIRACIKHEELANKLATIKQKQQFMNILGREIEILRNPGLGETAKFFEEDMGKSKKAVEKNTGDISNIDTNDAD